MLSTGKILRRETERTVMTALTRRVFELHSPKRCSDGYADARASKLLRLRRISRSACMHLVTKLLEGLKIQS